MTYIIGLTGSIACGKTTVRKILCDMMKRDNILKHHIDCDEISHRVIAENNEMLIKLLEKFFREEKISVDVQTLLNKDGYLDRHRAGHYIFNNEGLRKKWDKIIQRKVFRKIMSEVWNHYSLKGLFPGTKQDIILIDMPLLFETPGAKRFMTKIICVSIRNNEKQLKRLLARSTYLNEDQAKARINAQLPPLEKEKMSDYIIYNDGEFEELKENIETAYKQLKSDLQLY